LRKESVKMKLPPTVRPSLLRIVTLRLVITSVLAMLLQLTIVVARAYFDEDELNRSYVTREAEALVRLLRVGPQGLRLRSTDVPQHYRGEHAAAYAFRVLSDSGKIVAEQNGAMLAQLSPWREKPSRTQDLWLLDLDTEQKLYVAGGLRQKIGAQDVWVEVATWADPNRVYLGIVAQVALDEVWMPMIPLVLLTLGVAIFSIRRSLVGLVRAATEAEGMSPMDGTRRFDVSGLPREAAIFAVAINELLDRVRGLVTTQRMFIARAAHELRTPLAVMMLELDRDNPRIDRVQADVRGMSGTVDHLLTLARLESVERLDIDAVDAGKIAMDLADRMHDWAARTQHAIAVKVREPAEIVGDAVAIREAIRNLIENAVRHTPRGGQIDVSIGPGAAIVVEDDGPGFADEDVADLLQPFKKGVGLDDGSGLGLAIVKQVIDLHQGILEIGRSSRGGAKIVLIFPRGQAGVRQLPVANAMQGHTNPFAMANPF
jgi:two-component system, OmpR family, sensor histidine kinase QseC